MSYLDGSIDWLHLVDGGISDNLGLRAFYTVFSMQKSSEAVFRQYGHENVRHVLIISVNAAVHPKRTWSQTAELPQLRPSWSA